MKARIAADRVQRGVTFRGMVIAGAVAGAAVLATTGAYLYHHENSAGLLAARAQLAIEQHDPTRAIEYLGRALAHHPGGETGIALEDLMARAMMDAGREPEARTYLQKALAEKPGHPETLDLLSQSYVNPALRKLREAFKPLSEKSTAEIVGTIATGLNDLGKMPPTAGNLIAEGQLCRLRYLLLTDQAHQATAEVDAAHIASDENAAAKAQAHADQIKGPAGEQRDLALTKLREALKADPKNATASSLIGQYEYQDRHYAAVVAMYEEMLKQNAVAEDLALSAARAVIADETAKPLRTARLAGAEAILQAYLKDHPKSARIEVSLGDVLLDENHVAEAVTWGQRAAADSPGDLASQILLVNCRLRENKVDEALRLIVPLTTQYSNQAEVWYLLGLADLQAGGGKAGGKSADAADAFRKALTINAAYTPARQALLVNEMQSGNLESAGLIASDILRDDRYNMAAWEVTVEGMRKRGQMDRARQLLAGLAADPELPVEAKPGLVRLLATYDAADAAARLLATMPADAKSTLTLRAYVAGASGNSAASRELMAQALAADPEDVELRLKYVQLLAQAGLGADVRAQLDVILAKLKSAGVGPAELETGGSAAITAAQAVEVGKYYLNLRLPTEAAAAVKPALDVQPQPEGARDVARQAAAMLQGSTGAQVVNADSRGAGGPGVTAGGSVADAVRMATAALAQKKYPEALTAARAGLAQNKGNLTLHEIAAQALAGLGQSDQAVDEAVAAAQSAPDAEGAYGVFVDLFSTPDAAMKGIGYGSRLESVNGAFGAWAMGRLAEVTGDNALALRYYTKGLDATGRMADARAAKDSLYQAVIRLYAHEKDAAALAKAADTLAEKDEAFAPGIRLLAADLLTTLGDRAGAQGELDKVAAKLTATSRSPLILAVANGWMSLGKPEQALGLMEKQVGANNQGKAPPELLEAYASLLMQAGKAEKAVEICTELCKADAGNPQYRVALAQTEASAGDMPAALRSLDAARAMGATGKELADGARMRLLIAMGLLNEASQELAARSEGTAKEDAASQLAIAQAWAQLGRPEDARKMAELIPAYAAEYPAGRIVEASLDLDAGKADAAVAELKDLAAKSPGSATQIAPQLFVAYLRANQAGAALDLAKQQRDAYPAHTAAWRTWVVYAATAAREGASGEGAKNAPATGGGGGYEQAIALLNSLDEEGKQGAQLDIALMEILANKPAEATATAGGLSDQAPGFTRSTILLLIPGAAGRDAATMQGMLKQGPPSAVLAALAAMPAEARGGAMSVLATNQNVFAGDLQGLLKQLEKSPDAGAALRQAALVQRLLEAGWSTTALAQLSRLEAIAPGLALAAVQRHQALTDLHRFDEADRVRDALAEQLKQNAASVSPSARVLLAAAWSKQEKYAEALAVLEPLESLKRPDILTTLATLHEKMGELDKAIALHREVRQINPNDIAAANNLAYTLAAAHGSDQAALAEARKAIEFAIGKAPQITAFQDTLGWIEILSGNAADGTRRIVKVLPSLRLDPAVHYHVGMGYAREGESNLARMHLMNVSQLAHDRKNVPELLLATEALRTLAAAQ